MAQFDQAEEDHEKYRHKPIIQRKCVFIYSILFYSILFSSILFYPTLFYSILFYSILFCSVLFYPILFHSILFYVFLLYPFFLILFYSIGLKGQINSMNAGKQEFGLVQKAKVMKSSLVHIQESLKQGVCEKKSNFRRKIES